MLSTHSTLPAIFDRDAFAEYLEKMNRDMWNMYDAEVRDAARRAEIAEGQDGELVIFREEEEEEIEMSAEEYDRYLDDWSTNMPEDIFEQLVARRSARLKMAFDAARIELHRRAEIAAEHHEAWRAHRLSEGLSAADDGHEAALWKWVEEQGAIVDAAEDAYENR